MEFTKKEKSALASVLTAIIYADGFIDNNEVDYLGLIKFELQISDDDLQDGINMEPADALAVIAAMEEDKKKFAGQIMMRMAYADRKKLDPVEYELITGIFLKCGITPEE